jgi:hypothetical protein
MIACCAVPDIAGPIENAMAKADADYNCNAYLCRGYQFDDNADNVLAVTAGEVLYFHVDLIAGHHPGYAVCFFFFSFRCLLSGTSMGGL